MLNDWCIGIIFWLNIILDDVTKIVHLVFGIYGDEVGAILGVVEALQSEVVFIVRVRWDFYHFNFGIKLEMIGVIGLSDLTRIMQDYHLWIHKILCICNWGNVIFGLSLSERGWGMIND